MPSCLAFALYCNAVWLGWGRIYEFMCISRYVGRCLIWLMHVAMFAYTAGYRGKNCEENIDDCPGNLCLNGATCVDDINRYSCLCPPTYMGELCEQDVDECGQRPSVCQNGATCTNSIGGFSCICVNGWAGPDCSVNIDDCAGAACFNGATCIDRVGSFYCRCTPGKTGNACHTACVCCGGCSDRCPAIVGAAPWAVPLRQRWHTAALCDLMARCPLWLQ